MTYVYSAFQPDLYDGKMFIVTVDGDEDNKFLVSVANDESEIPALVDYHLNPPAPAAYLEPVPQSISDRQFFQQLAIDGIITEADALASNAAVIPAALLTIIEAMPAEQQFPAKMLVSGATIFERNNPMTIAIGTAYGWTSAQIDDFFRAAALL